MKYSAFEQAAAEARAGIREIDAEIDRLKAHRELLEVFETLARQVLTVLPMSSETTPAGPGAAPVGKFGAPAAGEPAYASGVLKGGSESHRREEKLPESRIQETSNASEPRQIPRPDSPSQEEPGPIRSEGWSTSSRLDLPGIRKLV